MPKEISDFDVLKEVEEVIGVLFFKYNVCFYFSLTPFESKKINGVFSNEI